ncbi:hypothetical protein CC79DRAFT_1326516 [Sarocladium strictum]
MSLGGLVSADVQGRDGPLASIDFYSKPGCQLDYTDPESFVSNIQVYGEDKSDDELACFKNMWWDDDWPSNKEGLKDVWIDQSGIQKGCRLLLYDMTNPNPDPESVRGCVRKYDTFGDSGACKGVSLPETYCCGTSCGVSPSGDLFDNKRRDLPAPPPVSDLFSDGVSNGVSDSKKARNVVDIKRRAPLERLDRREECKWENGKDTDEPYLRYEKQYRIGPITKCNLEAGCTGSVALSYSETISQSFTTEMGMGATLFEVISLSMSMSYTEEEAEEKGFTYTHEYTVPNGASGYVAWEPIAECVKGKFTGDCDEWDSGVEGEACFLRMVNGIPDGTYTNVVEHA